jgi:DNA-3-methyladenine glycosylase
VAPKGLADFSILADAADQVAPRLLGCILERRLDGKTIRVRIVETEAYDEADAASHSYKGRTPRTDIMFGPAGYLYVYFTYGMHFCANIVTGKEGEGSAVLIRAVEPVEGEEILEERRRKAGIEATNGPAKLCQALGIDRLLNGHNLHDLPLRLRVLPALPQAAIVTTTRIGITHAREELKRFYIKDNRFVSKR